MKSLAKSDGCFTDVTDPASSVDQCAGASAAFAGLRGAMKTKWALHNGYFLEWLELHESEYMLSVQELSDFVPADPP